MYLVAGGICPATAGFRLRLTLCGPRRSRIVVESTPRRRDHLLHVPGSDTALWPPGIHDVWLEQFKGRARQWRMRFWLLLVEPAAPPDTTRPARPRLALVKGGAKGKAGAA